jgi:hypothetical protein
MTETHDTVASLTQSLTGDLKTHLTRESTEQARRLKDIIEAAPSESDIYDGVLSYVIWFVVCGIAVSFGVLGYVMQKHSFWLFLAGGGVLMLFLGLSRYQSNKTPFATLTRTHLRVRNLKTELPLTAIERYEVNATGVSPMLFVELPIYAAVYFNIFLKEDAAEPQVLKSNGFGTKGRWFRKRRFLGITCGGVRVKGVRGGLDGFCKLMDRHVEAAHATEELARIAQDRA